jgi:hypothetical protein
MNRGLGREKEWSLTSSAVYGCLTGIAVTSFHHVHQAISNDIPDNIYAHVLGGMIAGSLGSAILFVLIAAIRNRLRRRR